MHDQSEQFSEFLAGNKPLCVLERRKDSVTFDVALSVAAQSAQYSVPFHLHMWHAPEGVELVLSYDHDNIRTYLRILNSKLAWVHDRFDAQLQLGLLFGYDRASCLDYAKDWTPDFCKCSKCVGVIAALEYQSIEE